MNNLAAQPSQQSQLCAQFTDMKAQPLLPGAADEQVAWILISFKRHEKKKNNRNFYFNLLGKVRTKLKQPGCLIVTAKPDLQPRFILWRKLYMAYYHLEKLVKASFSPSQTHRFQYIIIHNNLFSEHLGLFPFSSGFGISTGCDTINLTFTKSRKSEKLWKLFKLFQQVLLPAISNIVKTC